MLKQQGFKFRLRKLRGDQARELTRWFGCARKVYNLALEWETEQYNVTRKYPGRIAIINMLPSFKEEHPYLYEPNSQVLQQKLLDLDSGFDRAFRGLGEMPVFKKKYEHDSIRIPQKFEVDTVNQRVWIPKLSYRCGGKLKDPQKKDKRGWLRFRMSRPIEGKISSVTISREAGEWYVSFQTSVEVPAPVHINADKEAGIDMGVVHAITTSDGVHLDLPVKAIKKIERQIAHEQKTLSRRVKYSENWKDTKRRIARLHHRIANIRRDCLHKHSTTIAKNHGFVAMEDLRVKNITKSAKGTVEDPGKNVAAKRGLNRAILRMGWGTFRTMLEHKMAWNGGKLTPVPPQNTSRTCPECGHVSEENRKTQACFHCVKCGHEANADVVAAINILEKGRTMSLRGETAEARPKRSWSRSFSKKREPTEVPPSHEDVTSTVGIPALKGGEDVNLIAFQFRIEKAFQF